MAPYKLEDNIREKLEARELKPSADAWSKLEAKLDAQQPKKKPLLWYYVAASFIGILLLASVFFNRNDFEGNNQIVNENFEQPTIENKSEILQNKTEAEKIASDLPANSDEEFSSEKVDAKTSKKETDEKVKKNSNSVKPLPQKKSEIDKLIKKSETVAEVSKNKKSEKIESSISEDEKNFNLKVDEVVASVKKLQVDNTDVTAAEVEALLKNAQREIQSQRILNSQKVDATALLQDVEWELDKSFRDKVFDALGEGFQKVRTAVSERND
ncbi:hypothetical protein O4H26_10910 [Aequorivita viscosa]|nr:hypothetical protein [Aequorivita viscosa]